MEDPRETTRERLRAIIENQREEIEQLWLERVQRDIVKTPGLELTQLRDGMPDYLIALSKALRGSKSTGESLGERGESAWVQVARDHGITRVRIGFDITQLIHEFVVLRRVISEVAKKYDPELVGAEPLLTELLDSAITVAVQAYVDARDYEARRTQAANIAFLNGIPHPIMRHSPPARVNCLDGRAAWGQGGEKSNAARAGAARRG